MAKRLKASGPVEGPWALPDRWRWDRLGAVANVTAGQSPPSAQVNKQGNGLPFFQGKAEFGAERPTARNWCATPTKIADAGDVLISVRAPVGPTNYAPERCGIGRGLAAIHSKTLSRRYLRYWLSATGHVLREKATGTTFEAITGDVLRHHVIPVPPIGLDETIVAHIDELFAEIDDGEAALARARDDLATWRKALLKAAVTGELTAEWRAANPPSETGAELLARILADRRARWGADTKNKGKRYVEPATPDLETMPTVPESWAWTTADALTSADRNAIVIGPFGSDLKTTDYRDTGVPLVFVRHIRSENFSGLRPQFVDLDKARKLAAHIVRSGDVLITKMGDPPGDAAIYPSGMPEAIVTVDFH